MSSVRNEGIRIGITREGQDYVGTPVVEEAATLGQKTIMLMTEGKGMMLRNSPEVKDLERRTRPRRRHEMGWSNRGL